MCKHNIDIVERIAIHGISTTSQQKEFFIEILFFSSSCCVKFIVNLLKVIEPYTQICIKTQGNS